MLKNLITDMGKYLPAQVVPAIVGMISIPIFTRLFTPAEYGNYILVLATVGVFMTISGWLSLSVIRFYPAAERDGRLEAFYGSIARLMLPTSAVLTLLFAVLILLIQSRFTPRLSHLMWIGVLVFIVSAFFVLLQQFPRARRQIGLYSGFIIWKSITAAGFGIGLVIVFHFGVEGLLWGSVFSLAISLPLLWKKSLGSISLASPDSVTRTLEMARYSFPLVAGNLAAWILSLSDRYILQFLRGSREVGVYSAGYNVSEGSIMALITLFGLAFAPLAIHIWEKEGEARSKEFLSKVTRLYLLVCIPAVVGLSVLARPVMNVMTGQSYFEGYKVIPLIAPGIFFLGLAVIFQAGFSFHKRTGFIPIFVMASGLLNVALNLLFVPLYGYIAAAFTTLISYAVLLLLAIFFSRRIFLWDFPFKTFAKVGFAAVVMGVAIFLINSVLNWSPPLRLTSGIGLGIVVYTLVLFLVGELKKEEIRMVFNLKSIFLK